MTFEQAHAQFIDFHMAQRKGDRLRRLTEGHQHLEKLFLQRVWWPTFSNFDHLHPEYEVRDFNEGTRYLDFAYIRLPLRLAIEVDGFGPHSQNIGRRAFTDNLHRQNQLLMAGWDLLRFSYDALVDQPHTCQQEVQQVLGTWIGFEPGHITASADERDVIRLAVRLSRPITARDITGHLGVNLRTASRRLRRLYARGWLTPATGVKRIRSYRLAADATSLIRMLQL